ncbi:hypothetical protein Cgig2_003752 [Carnegiea gigantea]|uniref:Uncharacterized protein n=1 Tax=Carnegiea gigantea TaxID=171969 RepID=A0A9Q1K7F9_9CARY|nr:hypothetical protein Cgig2_003752 [Carnegiea gigantea]
MKNSKSKGLCEHPGSVVIQANGSGRIRDSILSTTLTLSTVDTTLSPPHYSLSSGLADAVSHRRPSTLSLAVVGAVCYSRPAFLTSRRLLRSSLSVDLSRRLDADVHQSLEPLSRQLLEPLSHPAPRTTQSTPQNSRLTTAARQLLGATHPTVARYLSRRRWSSGQHSEINHRKKKKKKNSLDQIWIGHVLKVLDFPLGVNDGQVSRFRRPLRLLLLLLTQIWRPNRVVFLLLL